MQRNFDRDGGLRRFTVVGAENDASGTRCKADCSAIRKGNVAASEDERCLKLRQIPDLAAATAQGRLKGCFNRAILGPKLLIVNEIGYLPFRRDEANLFFNVVAKRYERGSMILTSNLLPRWVNLLRRY